MCIVNAVTLHDGIPNSEATSIIAHIVRVMEVMIGRICLERDYSKHTPGELIATMNLMTFKNSPSVI